MPRDRLLPDVLAVTASALETWRRCPRAYRARHLLGLPASDEGPVADFGLFVHALLEHVHRTGSCADAAHVTDVLEAHGVPDGPIPSMLARHAARCPQAHAEHGEHELEVARIHTRPGPAFCGVGRLDAVWKHDGFLDVRDYKTGGRATERVADDLRAQLQAWLVAPMAAQRGLRVRVRYEHLAPEVDEDPDPFEPDDDELTEVGARLHGIVVEIHRAAQDPDGFAGVADTDVCGRCEYRSICPDSAAPGEPTWPTPPDEDDEVVLD